MRGIFLLFFLGLSPLFAEALKVEISAEKAILMNAKNGKVLYEKQGYIPAYPASTTKIATALYALHVMGDQLDAIFTVKNEALASITPQAKKDSGYRSPPHLLETDGTHMSLKHKEELSLYELLHGLLISSANDAANVIALNMENSVGSFMEKVNDYLLSIGCKMTFFNNPHGLHHPAHMTTAYDLAQMARVGLENQTFREIVQKVRHNCAQTNLQEERVLLQTNLLLRGGPFHYSKALGVKTGSTTAAGKNVVAAASDGKRELIAVVMGCKSRGDAYQDIRKLFDLAFEEPKIKRRIFEAGDSSLSSPTIKGAKNKLKTKLLKELSYELYLTEDEPYKVVLNWELPSLPIKSGSKVGFLSVVGEKGQSLARVEIVADNDVARSLGVYVVAGAVVLLLLLFLLFKKRA